MILNFFDTIFFSDYILVFGIVLPGTYPKSQYHFFYYKWLHALLGFDITLSLINFEIFSNLL